MLPVRNGARDSARLAWTLGRVCLVTKRTCRNGDGRPRNLIESFDPGHASPSAVAPILSARAPRHSRRGKFLVPVAAW